MKTKTRYAMPMLFQMATPLLGVLFWTGCHELKSEYYPGEAITLPAEILETDSVWQWGDEKPIHVHRSASPTLILYRPEWIGLYDNSSTDCVQAVFSEIGDQTFLSIRDEEIYRIMRVVLPGSSDTPVINPDTILLFGIDINQARKHVRDGKLNASIKLKYGYKERSGTVLRGTKVEQDDYFRNHPNSIWNLNSATLLRKISEKGVVQPKQRIPDRNNEGDAK